MPDQAKSNYDHYATIQKELEQPHQDRYVLLHDCTVVDIYDTHEEAYAAGYKNYGLGNFFYQYIGATPIDLRRHTIGLDFFIPNR